MNNEMKDWLLENTQEKKVMLNRAQRRAYAKRVKNDRTASICPKCGNKSRYRSKTVDTDTALICEVCGDIVRHGPDVTKAVPPGIILPLKLEMFDMFMEAAKEQLEENKEEKSNGEEE